MEIIGNLLALPDVSSPRCGAHTVKAVGRLNDFGPKGSEDLGVFGGVRLTLEHHGTSPNPQNGRGLRQGASHC
jgi:hypothetical protein